MWQGVRHVLCVQLIQQPEIKLDLTFFSLALFLFYGVNNNTQLWQSAQLILHSQTKNKLQNHRNYNQQSIVAYKIVHSQINSVSNKSTN